MTSATTSGTSSTSTSSTPALTSADTVWIDDALPAGAGGLGSPLALYLAAAGVGTLGVMDFDVVDYTNLQRQVLFGSPDVGRRKPEAARARLAALNPDVRRMVEHSPLGQVLGHERMLFNLESAVEKYEQWKSSGAPASSSR